MCQINQLENYLHQIGIHETIIAWTQMIIDKKKRQEKLQWNIEIYDGNQQNFLLLL